MSAATNPSTRQSSKVYIYTNLEGCAPPAYRNQRVPQNDGVSGEDLIAALCVRGPESGALAWKSDLALVYDSSIHQEKITPKAPFNPNQREITLSDLPFQETVFLRTEGAKNYCGQSILPSTSRRKAK